MAIVLVVDDEIGIGHLLEAVLTDHGHHVVTAINGKHALEQIAATWPDLIISDLMMPVMDGGLLLRTVREDAALAGIPFVLMCALPESFVTDRVSGYDAYVQKPFKLAAMSELAARLLGGAG
jgi:CheY-like chemotaxis protein